MKLASTASTCLSVTKAESVYSGQVVAVGVAGNDHHRRSVVKTTISRIKLLPDGHLNLRNHDVQTGETMAMLRTLNQIAFPDMPGSVCKAGYDSFNKPRLQTTHYLF